MFSSDCRDDAQTKMLALKEKSDKDIAQHNMELKELMRIIDHDRKLKEFMGIKSEDRSELTEGLTTARKAHEKEKMGDKDDTIEVMCQTLLTLLAPIQLIFFRNQY